MNSLGFAFLTLIAWGVGDVFNVFASRKIGGFSATFWVYVIAFVLTSFYLPFEFKNFFLYTPPIFILNLILGALLMIGNSFFAEATTLSNASLVGVISSSAYSGLAVILSTLVFRESLPPLKILSFVLVIAGVILCSLDFRELKSGHLKKLLSDRGVIYALIAMVCWSVDAVFLKFVIDRVGWFLPMYISLLMFPFAYFSMKKKQIPLVSPLKKGAWFPTFLTAVFIYGGEFTYSLGLKSGSPALVSSVSGAYPVLFAAIAYFTFKDKLRKQQLAGIFMTLFGIVLLSFIY